tara:strand:+ start:1280 stop:2344 length:1065 start_codon:yes stop_codon:yes gene_type:complete
VVDEIDRRSAYLAKKNAPVPFEMGSEMRNFNAMTNLQNQASTFTANDPRIQELKDRRRQYNRFDKYKIGDNYGMSPLAVQRDFADNTNVFRNNAPSAYKTMYPITDMAMNYTSSGGLLGMIAKNLFENVKNTGKDMMEKKGIFGAVDADEEEMEDYAAQTFGFGSPTFPGSEMTIPYPQQGFPQLTNEVKEVYDPNAYDPTAMESYPVLLDDTNPRGEVSSARSGPLLGEGLNVPLGYEENILDVLASEDAKAFPPPVKEPPTSLEVAPPPLQEVAPKFNDSNREAGIASMYGQGPSYATNNRRYEKEYRQFTENMSDTMRKFGPVTYEEFEKMYEKMFQGKPQVGFSQTLVNR